MKSKINYKAFDLTKFNFRDNEKTNLGISLIIKIMGGEERTSPIIHSTPSIRKLFHYNPIRTFSNMKKRENQLLALGKAVTLDKFISTDLLQYHKERLEKEFAIRLNIYIITALILFLIPLTFLITSNLSILLIILSYIVMMLYLFVAAGIAMRFSEFVMLRYFSDSLCIETLVFLIVELARCRNPMTLSEKKRLLVRTNFLAKVTRFYVHQYSLDTNTLDWVSNHFRQIEYFIREREKWIIASKDSTLADLQQDFYNLALTYISGNFGNFEYKTGIPSATESITSNYFKNFLFGIPRITIGILLPLSVLFIISLRPELFSNIIDVKVLTLISIGWFLLAIDAILKLGIVTSVIEVAKGIKELT